MAVRQSRYGERADAVPAVNDVRPAVRPIRILMVEDVPAEAELSVHQLHRHGLDILCQRVENEPALRAALLDFKPDIVLSDFTLPQFDGLSALAVVREMAPDVPFIFVSGTIGEERAIEALQCGAVDYVLKTNLARLPPAVSRAMQEAEAALERRRQEERIAHLTRVLRMLSGINGAMLRIRSSSELFDEACRLAVTAGGYATAGVLMQEPGTGTIQLVAGAGVDEAANAQLREFAAAAAERRTVIVTSVLERGSMFVCQATGDLPAADAGSALLASAGSQAIVALPIGVDQTTIGLLMLTSPHAGALGSEELQMLQEVAANLSFALQYLQKDNAVHFLSHFDPHTGLPKRALFCERLGRLQAREPDGRCAVAIIDIEQLSVINDSFGRHIGDALLQHVTDRLRRQFQYTELLAQFGGGIFAVAVDSPAGAGIDLAGVLCSKLDAAFARPFEMGERAIPVVIKSGVALCAADGWDAATLVQNAEAALHKARTSGQRHHQYNVNQHSEVVARLALEHQLRTAIERRQFELHYQPKVGVQSGRVQGVEGLIRWRHPESGLMAPDAFLPLLESTGLIVEVGEWVIEQAARDCQSWRQLGIGATRIAVNISPIQLRRPDFAQRFLRLTEPWACESCGLDIEITESALLEHCVAEVEQLERLRKAGVGIAIDDFGVGYSSLSRLSELPVDTLKIDRSFINRLQIEPSGRPIVSTIITLAHAFGMTVVAEGVETAQQLAALTDMGCDQLQGYLLSRPVAAERFIELMQAGGGSLPSMAAPAASAARPSA